MSTIAELEARVAHLEALVGMRSAEKTLTPVKGLLQDIAVAYQVRVSDVTGPCRDMRFVLPRHLFCWLARQSGLTFVAIGRMLNRDHGAIMNACASIEDRLDTEPELRKRVGQMAAQHNITLPERYRG